MNDDLVTNFNAIDAIKTQYNTDNTDKTVLENIIDDAIKEIPDSCGLVK